MTYCDMCQRPVRPMFQSLFWWILYCDEAVVPLENNTGWSFNPCFGGSYIVTLAIVNPYRLRAAVSILVLVDLIL